MTLDAGMGLVWQAESPWVVAWVAACVFVVLRRNAESRTAARNTGAIFVFATLAQLAAGVLHAIEMNSGAVALHNVALLIGGVAAIRLTGMAMFRAALPAAGFMVPRIVEDLVTILGYLVWIIARLRATGMDPSSILASTAVITAVLAFALQDTLGNILGGIAVQLDSSIEVGDWIRVDDVVGRVVDIRWRSTSVETRDWETIVFPNSTLMKGKFAVLGRRLGAPLQWRRHVRFSVELSAPPTRVMPALEQAIRESEIDHVAREPAPNCVLMGFEHGYATYDLRYWLTDMRFDDPTDSKVRIHVFTALQRAGWRLAVAEHGVRLTEQTEAHRKDVQEREVTRRLAALATVELLGHLQPEELRAIAERLTYSPFAQGELITRQGNVAHWLYMLTAGEADIVIDAEGGPRRFISTLSAGSFFGEAGLLTGAPRTATVVARTNVECYRLDKASFEGVLKSRPEIAEQLSIVMAARQGALAAAIAGHAAATSRDHESRSAELLESIRRFFGLDA
jgi:small-conductance mechanosensitive channel/CRP-like cAMP-binding protein